MNVTKRNNKDLTATITVKLVKEDYEAKVNESIKQYRKTAKVDGFRMGHVPEGLVRKMYGKYMLVDEINKIVSDSLSKYLEDKKIEILGDPMPSENQKPIDFEKEEEYEFSFQVGLAPAVDLELSQDINLVRYNVTPDDKLIDDYEENYARRFGSFVTCEEISSLKEMIRGDFHQLTADGNIKLGGIKADDTAIYLEFVQSEKTREAFKGLKVGSEITLDVKEAFNNSTEIASMLRIKKEDAEAMTEVNFKYTVASISEFKSAEINQELFDKVYGKDVVKTEEEFRAKLQEEIRTNLNEEAAYKFRFDTKKALVELFTAPVPVEFLKRWLLSINKERYTQEDIERDYPMFEKDLRWQMLRNKYIKQYEIKADDKEVLEYAKKTALTQYRQYGILEVPEEQLMEFAKGMLSREQDARALFDRLYDEKTLDLIAEKVTITTKEISQGDFNKLIDEE